MNKVSTLQTQFPSILKNNIEIANYIQNMSPHNTDYELMLDHFRGCQGILKVVDIDYLIHGDKYHNLFDKKKYNRYKKMPMETIPPLVVENGKVMDGNHRLKVALNNGLNKIRVYDIIETPKKISKRDFGKISFRHRFATKPFKLDANQINDISRTLLRDFYSKIKQFNKDDYLYQHTNDVDNIKRTVDFVDMRGLKVEIKIKIVCINGKNNFFIGMNTNKDNGSIEIFVKLNSSFKLKYFLDNEEVVTRYVFDKMFHEVDHALTKFENNALLNYLEEKKNRGEKLSYGEEEYCINSKDEFYANLQEIMNLVRSFVQEHNIKSQEFKIFDHHKKIEIINSIIEYCEDSMGDFFEYIGPTKKKRSPEIMKERMHNFKKIKECIYRYLVGEFQ